VTCATFAILKRESSSLKKSRRSGQRGGGASHKAPPKYATAYAPWTITVNVKWVGGKRIQCWSNAWQHIPIYLQPFTSYSEILVGYCNFFLPSLHLTPPLGCSHWNSGKKLCPQKTRIMGLPGSEDSVTIG